MIKTQNETIEQEGVGIIIGRFQTSELHQGHIDLFDSVISRHEKVICILGLAPQHYTQNNPYDYATRLAMLKPQFPDVEFYYNKDVKSNELWSKRIDELVSTHSPFESDVTLYGSRDSFIKHYSGKHKCEELIQETFTSATHVRKKLKFKTGLTKEHREGIIIATQNRYPTAYSAVDVAIVDFSNKMVLLGKKPNEDQYRFVGGFTDPRTDDMGKGNFLEINARREVMEETGLVIEQLDYIGSYLINDWRYRGEVDKIFSTMFIGHYTSGAPIPADDIEMCKWVKLQPSEGIFPLTLNKNEIVEEHHNLVDGFLAQMNKHFLT